MRARSVLCLVGGGSLLLGLLASPAWAEPEPNRGRCIAELAQAGLIGRDFNPGKANIVVGTEGDDVFDSRVTPGVDFICGFGGNDRIETLDAGDVFLGGDGRDSVAFNFGTFSGGEGNDLVDFNYGTFNGGPGDDQVAFNESGAVFNGGEGNEQVDFNFGTFNGGEGNDQVIFMDGGTFSGGPGNDEVVVYFAGSCSSVEAGCPA